MFSATSFGHWRQTTVKGGERKRLVATICKWPGGRDSRGSRFIRSSRFASDCQVFRRVRVDAKPLFVCFVRLPAVAGCAGQMSLEMSLVSGSHRRLPLAKAVALRACRSLGQFGGGRGELDAELPEGASGQ